MLLALGAGLLAAGALAFTVRSMALSRNGRSAGRYATAVEQLGSAELDVRIGGIHALERVAREAPADHPAVMQMLAAFIREHSRPQWPPSDPGGPVRERPPRPDVQAAITAVGRRLSERDTGPVDLTRADLTGADLAGADLAGADLGGARLTGADLGGADLTGANLADTDLTGADLAGTDLTRAELTGALWPLGWPVPAGWARHAGCGQLIPAGASAAEDSGQPAARLSLPRRPVPARQAGPVPGLERCSGLPAGPHRGGGITGRIPHRRAPGRIPRGWRAVCPHPPGRSTRPGG